MQFPIVSPWIVQAEVDDLAREAAEVLLHLLAGAGLGHGGIEGVGKVGETGQLLLEGGWAASATPRLECRFASKLSELYSSQEIVLLTLYIALCTWPMFASENRYCNSSEFSVKRFIVPHFRAVGAFKAKEPNREVSLWQSNTTLTTT